MFDDLKFASMCKKIREHFKFSEYRFFVLFCFLTKHSNRENRRQIQVSAKKVTVKQNDRFHEETEKSILNPELWQYLQNAGKTTKNFRLVIVKLCLQIA